MTFIVLSYSDQRTWQHIVHLFYSSYILSRLYCPNCKSLSFEFSVCFPKQYFLPFIIFFFQFVCFIIQLLLLFSLNNCPFLGSIPMKLYLLCSPYSSLFPAGFFSITFSFHYLCLRRGTTIFLDKWRSIFTQEYLCVCAPKGNYAF